ncbi:hypothetical protein A2U01_0074138, partial [Trifolium medium]|nr:hypothetical protein [Trifolium medium]
MLLASGENVTEHDTLELITQGHLPEFLGSRLGEGGRVTMLSKLFFNKPRESKSTSQKEGGETFPFLAFLQQTGRGTS